MKKIPHIHPIQRLANAAYEGWCTAFKEMQEEGTKITSEQLLLALGKLDEKIGCAMLPDVPGIELVQTMEEFKETQKNTLRTLNFHICTMHSIDKIEGIK